MMSKKELTQGFKFHFDNELDCIENMHDDFRGGYIVFDARFRTFFIWFNGGFIDSRKTFNALKKRVDTLFNKWGCKWTHKTDLEGEEIKIEMEL
jgi:hypothetical protein